ncbi:MAG TPA: DUF1707 domain-containing protein [Streptosporangiaceae bacterium]
MVAGPGHELTAAGRGELRASHADRDQVIGMLKAAFVQGRLTKEEFDERVGQAFASRTYAELATITADLPAGLTTVQPRAPVQAQGWLTMERAVTWSACMILPTATATATGWLLAGRPDAGPVILLSFLAFIVATIVSFTMIGEAWEKSRRSSGQLPPGPAPAGGGHASPTPGSARAGRLPRLDHGPQDAALAVRDGLPGSRSRTAGPPRRWCYSGFRYVFSCASQ